MRFVDRSTIPVPKDLSAPPFKRMRQEYHKFLLLDPKQRAQTRPPDRHLPTTPDIQPHLAELFLGKCALCESLGSLVPYRFRPTSEALPLESGPEANLYYGWLADAWQNLYPICPGCLSTQSNYFPVDGPRSAVPTADQYADYLSDHERFWSDIFDEKAILLDPCKDIVVGTHLVPLWDGRFDVRTNRGKETIRHFNLNRSELVARRATAFLALRARLDRGQQDLVKRSDEFAASLEHLVILHNTELATTKAVEAELGVLPLPKAIVAEPETLWQLQSVEIKAFKSLENVRVEMPTSAVGAPVPALLILGENATGKSSFLEAIALAMLDDKARDSLGEDPTKLLLDPRYLGSVSQLRRERAEIVLTFSDRSGSRIERRLMLTPNGFQAEGPLPANFPVFGYGAYRHYRSNYRGWNRSRPVISLFRSDNLLSNPERWLLTLREDRFDMVVRALRDIFVSGFSIIQRDVAAQQCMMVIEQEGVSSRTPLDSVSSGFRTILALTCDVMRWLMKRDPRFTTLDMARGLVLIDEVEAHLHPRWKLKIMDGLRRALPNMTFIVTTHDPLCLRGMRDGEVLVLRRIPGTAAGSELPVMVEILSTLPDVTKLTVEQLLTSDLFSIFDTDDPVSGQAMADLADALAFRRSGVEVTETRMQDLLAKFRDEINDALPVGSTEVSRLVQEAVADYIIERRAQTEPRRHELRDETKRRIRQALDGA